MAETTDKDTTLEELFAQVEEVLVKLESSEIGIEEAFEQYSTGMQLIKACNEKIDRVEKKVLVLSENMTTEEFK